MTNTRDNAALAAAVNARWGSHLTADDIARWGDDENPTYTARWHTVNNCIRNAMGATLFEQAEALARLDLVVDRFSACPGRPPCPSASVLTLTTLSSSFALPLKPTYQIHQPSPLRVTA